MCRCQVISEDKDLKFRMKIVIDEDCPLSLSLEFNLPPPELICSPPPSHCSKWSYPLPFNLCHLWEKWHCWCVTTIFQGGFKGKTWKCTNSARNFSSRPIPIQPNSQAVDYQGSDQKLPFRTNGAKTEWKSDAGVTKSESKSEKVTVRGGGRAGASLGKIPV